MVHCGSTRLAILNSVGTQRSVGGVTELSVDFYGSCLVNEVLCTIVSSRFIGGW